MPEALLDPAAIADFGGELLQPDDARYDDARRVFNAMIDRFDRAMAPNSNIPPSA